MKNVLVLGSQGFIAKNLIQELKKLDGLRLVEFHKFSDRSQLKNLVEEADFIFHLAGVNRSLNPQDFFSENVAFTNEIVGTLKNRKNPVGVIFASSVQATNQSVYGISKRQAEESLLSLASTSSIFVYRLPNVFGEGCRPYYNSAVATFCYNLKKNLPIVVHDENAVVRLVYVKDVISTWILNMHTYFQQKNLDSGFREAGPVQEIKIGQVAEILSFFKRTNSVKLENDRHPEFTSKLVNTFLSYE